jgi:hypothetical protein
MRALLRIAGAPLLAASLAAGCCGPQFRVADTRAIALETPYDALDIFRTAVRVKDWGAAYDCLSARTKQFVKEEKDKRALGALYDEKGAFAYVLTSVEVEDLMPHAPTSVAHMTVAQLIERASERAWKVDLAAGRAWAFLSYPPLDYEAFAIVRERAPGQKERWTVGIAEWLDERE